MATSSVKILLIEDEEAHAEAVLRAFRKLGNQFTARVARTLAEAGAAVEEIPPDVVISDLALPDGKGTEILTAVGREISFPLIIMTSRGNEQAAVEAIKAGALDYVVKSPETFSSMPRTADRALREWENMTQLKKAEAELRESQECFRAVFESATDSIFIKDTDLRYTHVNPAMCEMLGLSQEEMKGRKAEDLYGLHEGNKLTATEERVLAGEFIEIEQTRTIRGVSQVFHDTIVPLRSGAGDINGICGVSRNITERKKLATILSIGPETYPSKAMKGAIDKARMASNTDSIVLLQGPSGCGKDHLARWIHQHSRRGSGPFLSINCAAISRELAESELFGHERGAYTGAVGLKKGMLELAEGGTILLNEIGELELSLQAKLLTFLDTKSFLRVGGLKEVHVSARLIAATHRDLQDEVEHGRFLEPLFYRLSVFPLNVPALAERKDDIPILAEEILAALALEMQLPEIPRMNLGQIEGLKKYHWPGNVRELRNVLERSLMLWRGEAFELVMPFAENVAGSQSEGQCYTVRYSPERKLSAVLDEVKGFLCCSALDSCGGNKKEAAKSLDVSRDAFYRYIKKMPKKS